MEQEILLKEEDLAGFTGTNEYYKHWIGNYVYTDGVKYIADAGGAYWLLDAIFSYARKEPFQIWNLEIIKKDNKSKAVLTMRADGELKELSQNISYTDFPFDITLWLVDRVLMLPSEY